MRKLQIKTEFAEGDILAERDFALSRYRVVLRSVRCFVEAADERNAGYTDILKQLRLLFKKERKFNAVFSSASLSQEGIWLASLESEL